MRALCVCVAALLLLLLSAAAGGARGSSVLLTEGKELCLRVEQPEDTPVLLSWHRRQRAGEGAQAQAQAALSVRAHRPMLRQRQQQQQHQQQREREDTAAVETGAGAGGVAGAAGGLGGSGGAAKESGVILEETVRGDRVQNGHAEFVTEVDGEHFVCLSAVMDAAAETQDGGNPTLLLDVDLSYGQDDEFYARLAEKEHLGKLELQVTRLNDMIGMMLNEADYMQEKEMAYHEQTERMKWTAQWWPILQVVLVIVTGVYQVHYLKHFFIKNKLI